MNIQPKRFKRASLSACAATVLSASAAFALPLPDWYTPDDDKDVLVAGVSTTDYLDGKRAPNGFLRAPLLQGQVDYLMNVFEWTYELSMTKAERDEFTRRLASVWGGAETESHAPGVFRVLEWRSAIDQFSSDLYSDRWGRTLKRQEQTIALRQAARSDKENGAWLLSIYDKYNPPLAPGEPRLTRLATNALTERVVFMINEVIGKPAAKRTPALQKKIAGQMAAMWPRLTPARRQEILKMETDFWWLSQSDYGWKSMGEAGREELRIQWGGELVKAYPAIKPMYLFRKNRLEKARRKAAQRWARMSAREKQLAIMALQNQAQMNQMMVTTVHNMNVQNYATNMNIIENMKPVPQYHYSVK